ncbi:DUF6745 domain-containing protein [Microcoleus sp. herbarium5]|uniref:DUF6745 domain-containing protein n=1 Tax=Microcoleus sp. herbarium5 TaxID=3055434 RepID=UPI002FD49913
MSPTKMKKLTPDQEALIPVYRDKWRKIALSTERIDRAKAESAIKAAYIANGKPEPEVEFYSSPCVVWKSLSCYWQDYYGNRLRAIAGLPLTEIPENQLEIYELGKRLFKLSQRPEQLYYNLLQSLQEPLESVKNPLESHFENLVPPSLIEQLDRQSQSARGDYAYICWSGGLSFFNVMDGLKNVIVDEKFCFWNRPEVLAGDAAFLDFGFSVLDYPYDREKWEILQELIVSCGWIYSYEKTCIVCDRPIKLSFDSQDRLHAEGKPAIQFADGWGFYSYHGITLPEKYGAVPPKEWQSQWVLQEHNSEFRRALIQGIGYVRVCEELQATELDSWAEYTLLKIDEVIDDRERQPFYLLKMTCPSTGFIHAMRVPPDMRSAREAIRWVNWGIDPQEFSVQT